MLTLNAVELRKEKQKKKTQKFTASDNQQFKIFINNISGLAYFSTNSFVVVTAAAMLNVAAGNSSNTDFDFLSRLK